MKSIVLEKKSYTAVDDLYKDLDNKFKELEISEDDIYELHIQNSFLTDLALDYEENDKLKNCIKLVIKSTKITGVIISKFKNVFRYIHISDCDIIQSTIYDCDFYRGLSADEDYFTNSVFFFFCKFRSAVITKCNFINLSFERCFMLRSLNSISENTIESLDLLDTQVFSIVSTGNKFGGINIVDCVFLTVGNSIISDFNVKDINTLHSSVFNGNPVFNEDCYTASTIDKPIRNIYYFPKSNIIKAFIDRIYLNMNEIFETNKHTWSLEEFEYAISEIESRNEKLASCYRDIINYFKAIKKQYKE